MSIKYNAVIFVCLYLHNFTLGLGEKCFYPSLAESCTKISQSEDSDWTKVIKWREVLLSLDLTSIKCVGDFSSSKNERVITETSPKDEDLFDFNFKGSSDENQFLEEHGKLINLIRNSYFIILFRKIIL